MSAPCEKRRVGKGCRAAFRLHRSFCNVGMADQRGQLNADDSCDMGEGFGLYRLGDDAAIMPFIDLANVACGFHASDATIMRNTVRLAKKHAVKVGAHP